MSLHVSLRPARNIFALALLAASVCAAQVNAQQAPKAPAESTQAPSAKTPAVKTTNQAAPQQAAPASGMVVFVDPLTGQIRQPDAAEIGELTAAGAGNVRAAARTAAPASLTTFNGPGGAVGVMLGDDSLSYSVVTRTPGAKFAEDCVTGEKAASALASKGATPKTTAAPKKNVGVLDVQ
jgi:hypothetical protein